MYSSILLLAAVSILNELNKQHIKFDINMSDTYVITVLKSKILVVSSGFLALNTSLGRMFIGVSHQITYPFKANTQIHENNTNQPIKYRIHNKIK